MHSDVGERYDSESSERLYAVDYVIGYGRGLICKRPRPTGILEDHVAAK
jgi:hypothetical protein